MTPIPATRKNQSNLVLNVRPSELDMIPGFDVDPFSAPLDETPVTGPPVAVLGSPISAAVEVVQREIRVTNNGSYHSALLRCPFCDSVFRSVVSERLTSCPVCDAMKVRQTQALTSVGTATRGGREAVDRLPKSGNQAPLSVRRRSSVSSHRQSTHAHRISRRQRLPSTGSILVFAAAVALCILLAANAVSQLRRELGAASERANSSKGDAGLLQPSLYIGDSMDSSSAIKSESPLGRATQSLVEESVQPVVEWEVNP